MRTRTDGRPWAYCMVAIIAAAAVGCSTSPAMDRHLEARRIAAELQVHFTKAAGAANKAVMADTDERSAAFARDAEQSTQAVQAGIDALRPLLEGLRYSEETQLLQEFSARFTEYRELDRRILALAVENTNLKAQRLSFGPAQEAADAFRDALEALPAAAGDRWRVQALVNGAVARVREIQAIQSPHIASDSDATMTSLEERMAAAEAGARAALDALSPLLPASTRPRFAAARAHLDRFVGVNAEIVILSRRNTNVRSLALTLNDKGRLTEACDERLQALQEALGKRQLGGTR